MKNKSSNNIIITIMVFVGTLIVISALMNDNIFVNAQQQKSPQKVEAPEKGTIFVFNEKSRPANDPEKCAALASLVKGKAVPDYNLCDIVVYRQAPPIVRNDGMVMNNFSGIGHYIEMVPAVTNDTGQFASADTAAAQQKGQNQSNLKVAFGEFALIDPEVVPVQQIMGKYNWTETALHHHLLNESPKILFLHWSVTGDANELIKQAKEMIMQTATYQNLTGNTRTPTSGGP
ncbi:MAG TPA: DUF1259 domain-containing protein [Nitrososphaeraceae archaeon]|jgi:hypothetical protein|nr:DUF1259 domain-containing protein [Nitrososphaeraceae archaeon]